MKFSNKLSLAILITGVIVLITVSYTIYKISYNSVIKSQLLYTKSIADEVSDYIDQLLSEKVKAALTLANTPIIKEALEKSNRSYDNLSDERRKESIKLQNDKWKSTKDLTDNLILKFTDNKVSHFLKNQQELLRGEYGEIFLTNKFGALVASTSKLSTFAHGFKYWWLGSYDNGKGAVFFDDRGYDDSVGGYVLGLVVPIRKGAEIIGILKCNLNILGSMSELIPGAGLELMGKFKLTRSGGMVVFEEGFEPLSTQIHDPIFNKMKSKNSESFIINDSGEKYLVGLSEISLTKEQKGYGFGGTFESIDHKKGNTGESWYVICYREMSVVLAPTTELTKSIVLVGIAIILILVLVSYLFGRKIAQPLTALGKATDEIGKGDFEYIIDTGRNDEFGKLAHSFNSMTSKLQQTTTSVELLENEVKHRKQIEERFQAIANYTYDWESWFAPDGRLMWVNPAVEKLTGYTVAQCEKMPDYPRSIVYEEDRTQFEDYLQEAIDKRLSTNDLEFRISHKDESIRWMAISWQPIYDSQDTHIGQRASVRDITSRKRASDALQESEKKHRAFFEYSQDAIFVADVETGMVLDANKTAQRILGKSLEEIVGMHPSEVVSPEEKKIGVERFAKVLKEKKIGPQQYDIVSSDGRRTCVEAKSNIIELKDRKLAVAFFRDITSRRRAEEKLRESEEKYRSMMEAMDDAVYICSPDYRVSYMNRAMAERTGWDAIDEPCYKALHELDEKCPWCVHNKTHPREGFQTEILSPKDGRFYHISHSPIFNEDGSISKMTIYSDITSRKRVEESLRESEEKYRLLVENANDAIFVAQDGVIKFPNAKTEEMTGYSAEELNKIPFVNHIHPDDKEMVIERYKRKLEEEDLVSSFSYRAINKTGEESWQNLNTVLISWEGRPATLNFARDITKIKRLEDQLNQTNKMEAIGTLAGGIAHDFNNILGIIMVLSDLSLLETPQGSSLHRHMKEILSAGMRAKNLVQQILTFSRQVDQVCIPMSIIPIVNEVLEFLRSSLPSTIEIRHNIEKDPGLIEGDPTQMHQVVMNLCTNAEHAMRNKGGVLDLELGRVHIDDTMAAMHLNLHPGPYVRLEVKDTGYGIEPATMERVFDPYFTTKSVGEGSGLGLTVVQGIVHKHGGTIAVESETGKGTVFEVFFPVIEGEKKVIEEQSEAPLSTGTERILLIDDEEALAEAGKEALEHLGYKVTIRTNSTEALELFKAKPEYFDLVITDMSMPNMTGEQLSQEFMKIRPELPIILCTGFSHTISEKKAYEIGIKAFLMKPLVRKDLSETIRQVLGQTETSRLS